MADSPVRFPLVYRSVRYLYKKALHEVQDFFIRAQDWIRTSTWFPTLRPEHSASTNFATWAELQRKQDLMNVERLHDKIFVIK